MVYLALANVFVYTLRYGVLVWAPKYLHDVRHASLEGGIAGFSILELAGIGGTVLCGYVSDRMFKGRRSPAGILFLIATVGAILLYWLPSSDAPAVDCVRCVGSDWWPDLRPGYADWSAGY